jgi:periodic tryptophan protein 2
MYDLRFRVLIKKFLITNNLSLDGIKLRINFAEKNFENSDQEDDKDNKLPGAKHLDTSKRVDKKISI